MFDLSNARVAKILKAKVIIVSQGGIGKPIDEVALNQALFEKEGVEIIGVILNKVITKKVDYVTDFARRGLKRRGLELLGVLPYQPMLSSPNMDSIEEELDAEVLNPTRRTNNLVNDVVIGAMGAQNVTSYFKPGVLLITPGDREDILMAASVATQSGKDGTLAGIVLTDRLRPSAAALKIVRDLPYPVLLTDLDNYKVASIVHDLIVKTRPDDLEKINVIRDLIAEHVDVAKILDCL